MDDAAVNLAPVDNSADDSTPSGSVPDGSGSNGGNVICTPKSGHESVCFLYLRGN